MATRAETIVELVKTTESVRGGKVLTLTRPVSLTADGEGVEVWVRLHEDGVEVRIDPHRVFINPPLQIVKSQAEGMNVDTGEFFSRQVQMDPEAAFWSILWDSVDSTPNSRNWRAS